MERLPSDDMSEIDISVNSTELATKSRRESFIDGIKDIQESMNDQDFKQKTSAYLTFGLEMYRVVMGTLLLLFVPQKCGDELCTMSDSMTNSDSMHVGNVSVNFLTFAAFLLMYVVEIRRENKMISYLDVNKEFPSDNDAVGEALLLLPENKRQVILNLDGSYQKACYLAAFFYLVNSVYSGIVIYDNYFDSKTTTVFITNLLFLAGKLSDVYGLANTDTNIFYSAYLKDKVQYNYADPDKVKQEPVEVDVKGAIEDAIEEEPKEPTDGNAEESV